MNYNDLSEETKLFLNKAMDIYSTIKDERIIQDVRAAVKTHQYPNYEFTKLDKKILSLFIAGFLVDGNLKELLSQYDDIKLKDLFDFIHIEENDITPIPEDQYEKFYETAFKLDLMTILEKGYQFEKVNFITPAVIINSFRKLDLSMNIEILDFFAYKYNVAKGYIRHLSDHPLFAALKNYALIDGSIIKKDSPKNNSLDKDTDYHLSNNNSLDKDTDHHISNPFKNIIDMDMKKKSPKIKIEKSEEETNEQLNTQSSSIDLDYEKLWLLLGETQKKFVGQETFTEQLFYNIVNNQYLAQMEELPDGQRSIIFTDGPTGTGKTAIPNEIAKRLDVPFSSVAIPNYSATGYVGASITDILKELYEKANGDLEKAQRGIIVLDEFDKIAYSRSGSLEMKRAVQQELLHFLGGGKYTIQTGNNIFDMKKVEFDTSKLTFICLGALTDLRSQKTEKKQPIGFGTSQQSDYQDYTITPQDLIEIGLERELVGRFNTYLHTEEYSKEELEEILKNSTISPLIGFRKWIELKGKKLQIDDDVYNLIAQQAYELNTGARSLQTIMNNIRTHFIKDVFRGSSDTIHLDAETVEQINGQTINRKGRI